MIPMQAPAQVSVGSDILFADGSVGEITAGGRVSVPQHPMSVLGMLAAGGKFISNMALPWVSGRWYSGAETFAAIIFVTGKIYATPIYVPTRVAVSALGVNVTTQQASSGVRLGIYEDNYGIPGAKIMATAEVATTGSGAADGVLADTPIIEPGWYWRVAAATSPGTFPSVSGVPALMDGWVNRVMGETTSALALAASAAGAVSGYIADFTYAALPDAFPSTNRALIVNASCPTLAIKVA